MKFQVNNARLVLLEDDTLVQNSTDIYTATFLFNEDWDGFTKTVNFVAGSVEENVSLTDDICTIPASCLTQAGIYLHIRVFGLKENELIQTNWQISRILYPTDTTEFVSGSSVAALASEVAELQESVSELRTLVEEGGGSEEGLEFATDEEVAEMIQDVVG